MSKKLLVFLLTALLLSFALSVFVVADGGADKYYLKIEYSDAELEAGFWFEEYVEILKQEDNQITISRMAELDSANSGVAYWKLPNNIVSQYRYLVFDVKTGGVATIGLQGSTKVGFTHTQEVIDDNTPIVIDLEEFGLENTMEVWLYALPDGGDLVFNGIFLSKTDDVSNLLSDDKTAETTSEPVIEAPAETSAEVSAETSAEVSAETSVSAPTQHAAEISPQTGSANIATFILLAAAALTGIVFIKKR